PIGKHLAERAEVARLDHVLDFGKEKLADHEREKNARRSEGRGVLSPPLAPRNAQHVLALGICRKLANMNLDDD
ncbi:MAG: hypothetical protein ACXWHF_05200, partial [Chthoniobacterales bacterium]